MLIRSLVLCALFYAFFLHGLWIVSGELVAGADVLFFFANADSVFRGFRPGIDFAFPYPAFALGYLMVPRLFSNNVAGYTAVLAALQLLLLVAMFYLIYAYSKMTGGDASVPMLKYAVLVLPLSSLVMGRYDLLPALLTFGAVYLFAKGSHPAAFFLLVLGSGLKYYPLLLLPIFAMAYLQVRPLGALVRALVPAALLAAAYGLVVVLAFHGSLADIALHTTRGVQIESTYASAVLLLNMLQPAIQAKTMVSPTSHSVEVASPFSDELSAASLGLLSAALLAIYVAAWHSRGALEGRLPEWCALAILAFLLTSKVLSPQYLLWLAPFLPFIRVGGRVESERFFALCALAVWLTFLIYPYLYIGHKLQMMLSHAVLTVVLRNALLVIAFAYLFLHCLSSRPAR